MIQKLRGIQGKDEFEISKMVNLNHNHIITLEEFLTFFMVNKVIIDN